MLATPLPRRSASIRTMNTPPVKSGRPAAACEAALRDMALVLHLTGIVKQAIVRGQPA